MSFHRLTANYNGHDMIATVHGEFFQTGPASGPISPAFTDMGELRKGDLLRLSYNYATDEYATQHGWLCEVVRINRKSITVKARPGGTDTYRVLITL